MIKYIHGSEDSIDIDVFYVFDELPDFKFCQEFCNAKEENRNIITMQNGVVDKCFKGTADEVNNGLYYTYHLHKQEHPLLVERLLERDVLHKDIRAFRGIFSYLSRTKYRQEIKYGLKSDWTTRIKILEQVDWSEIEDFGKTFSKKDILKVYAFQLGQSLGLYDGIELYTKSTISERYPELRKYLYREDAGINDILIYLDKFISKIKSYKVIEDGMIVNFCDFGKIVDLKTEKYLED